MNGVRQRRSAWYWARVYLARITSKGQSTIPSGPRRHLDIQPGDWMEMRVHGAGAFELRKLPRAMHVAQQRKEVKPKTYARSQ